MNFRQHISFALWTIAFIYSLYFVFHFNNISFLIAPILFVVGSIFPDIDLPKESKITRYIYYLVIPIVLGMTAGRYNYYIGLVTIIVTMIIFYPIDTYEIHWGHVHSFGGLFLFSGYFYFIFLYGFNSQIAAIVAASFAGGYATHIIGDEIYHEYKNKYDWNRFSCKLFFNGFKYDPLIILSKISRKLNKSIRKLE